MFSPSDVSSVSVKVTATNAEETKIRAKNQDLQIGRIFVAIMTGSASLMSLLGFVVTGHPLLLASGLLFAVFCYRYLPEERSYHNRPYHGQSVLYAPLSPPAIIVHDRYPIVDLTPPPRTRRNPPVVVHHHYPEPHPEPPTFVSSQMEQQVREPIGERVHNVYRDYPSAPIMPDVFTPSATLPQDYQDSRIEGTGATGRFKVGARRS